MRSVSALHVFADSRSMETCRTSRARWAGCTRAPTSSSSSPPAKTPSAKRREAAVSVAEKEGAALVTRPRLTNDQVLATLNAGPDATEGPDVEIAEGMIRVGFSRLLELLEQPENDKTVSRE